MEEIAGGRLIQVVVETEAIATLLLKNKCFNERITMIPMNKIEPYMPSQEIIDYVAQVTGGKAVHAVSLVKYQLALEKTM